MDKIKITKEQQQKMETLLNHFVVVAGSGVLFEEGYDKTPEMNDIKDQIDTLSDKIAEEFIGLFEVED